MASQSGPEAEAILQLVSGLGIGLQTFGPNATGPEARPRRLGARSLGPEAQFQARNSGSRNNSGIIPEPCPIPEAPPNLARNIARFLFRKISGISLEPRSGTLPFRFLAPESRRNLSDSAPEPCSGTLLRNLAPEPRSGTAPEPRSRTDLRKLAPQLF